VKTLRARVDRQDLAILLGLALIAAGVTWFDARIGLIVTGVLVLALALWRM
jgi:hypothetical protein